MIEHRCSIGERGGFFQRLRNGTYLGHILEHVTLELQTLAGTEVGFGKARETSEEGVYKVIVEYVEETRGPRVPGRRPRALPGRRLRSALRRRRPKSSGLRDLAQQVCLGPSTRAIVEAAQRARHSLPPAEYRQPGALRPRPRSSAAFRRPRPIAPAPSPRRSPKTRK